MTNEKIQQVSSDDFDDQIGAAEVPVMVDFWAPWCGPCLTVAPVIEELADELEGKVKFAKINVDQNQQLAAQFQVSSIPTFILFKNGEVADRMLGAMPKAAFKDFLSRNL